MTNLDNIKNDNTNQIGYIFLILIIVFNVLITLPVINRPLYSVNDSTRQIHTAAITRSLYSNHYNIFATQIYFCGQKITYIEEFPIYNILVVFCYKIFGVHEIFGRIIALLLFQATLIVFYLLLQRFSDIRTSLLAVFIFSFSYYSIYYNDFFQQTSMDILLLLFHLYFFSRFITDDSRKNYLLWLLFGTLNFVERPIFLVLLLPIAYFLLNKYGRLFWLKPRIMLFFAVSLSLTAAWYLFGYYSTGKAISGFYNGYFTPFRIFEKNNEYFITKYASFLFKSIIRNFSIIGTVILIIGIIMNTGKKEFRFIALWMLSIAIQMFLIPSKVTVHLHYLVPLFLSMSFFLALPLASLLKSIENSRRRNFIIIFLSVILLYFVFSNLPEAIGKKNRIRTYIQPIADRIAAESNNSDNIIFFGDHIQDLWSNSLLYATNSCGLMLDLGTDALGLINKYRHKYGLSYIAELKIKRKKYLSVPPECFNMNWLFSKFRLIDNFQDAYFLLNTKDENKLLKTEKDFQTTDLRFNNGSVLSGMQISKIYKKGIDKYTGITFLWKTNHFFKENKDLYLISINNENKGVYITHKLFGDVYPTSRWRPDKYYAETISIPVNDHPFLYEPVYLSLVLYDPLSGSIFKAEANKTPSPVVALDFINRKAWVQDISIRETTKKDMRIYVGISDINLDKNTIIRNYQLYRNIKNIEDTLEYARLQLEGFYPVKQ